VSDPSPGETAELPALWRVPLEAALHRERDVPFSRFVQLATVRPDGRPANRTLVFRDFLSHTDLLQFAVDDRSDKIADLRKRHWAEVCWYFPIGREQFRILGRVGLVGPDHADERLQLARVALWQSLSGDVRAQFTWPEPGAPRAADAEFKLRHPDPRTPLEAFVLLLLDPVEIDHLRLATTPLERQRYRLWPKGWVREAINP
jgi:pyridoxamine 5'-phosphate oxidase